MIFFMLQQRRQFRNHQIWLRNWIFWRLYWFVNHSFFPLRGPFGNVTTLNSGSSYPHSYFTGYNPGTGINLCNPDLNRNKTNGKNISISVRQWFVRGYNYSGSLSKWIPHISRYRIKNKNWNDLSLFFFFSSKLIVTGLLTGHFHLEPQFQIAMTYY